MLSYTEVARLRASILSPSPTISKMSPSSSQGSMYVHISTIAIKYAGMEATYASLPGKVRQNLTGKRGMLATEKIYAAAILGPQHSASLISRCCNVAAHLPQWPSANNSGYAPTAPQWFSELARLLDDVLCSRDEAFPGQLSARLAAEQGKMQRVSEMLGRLVLAHTEPIPKDQVGIHVHDENSCTWNKVCRMIAQGETVLDAERWQLLELVEFITNEAAEDTSLKILPLDL